MEQHPRGIFELPDRRLECGASPPCLLSAAAAAAGVVLNSACGGNGTCGGCAVELVRGRFASLGGEEIRIGPGSPRRVLACQTRWLGGDFLVRVPRRSLVEAGEQIVMDFQHTPPFRLRPPVRKEHLRLQPPELRDQRGDLERLGDALRRRGYEGPLATPLSVARRARMIAESDYDLTATVAGDQGLRRLIRLQRGDTTDRLYGAAVDIGTTTVVVALVDLLSGKVIDAASSFNRQIARGDNVASRISHAAQPGGLEELRSLVVESTINPLLRLLAERHGVEVADLAHMTVSGNTVMAHLFCGMSPAGLGGVPFAPITNFPGPYLAGGLGLEMNPEALVDVIPSTAAYVGGDITSDVYVCGLTARREVTALIDIGTNAEIVVGNRDRLIACAAPAGPAFEGHGLTCGMRAAAGAIESFALGEMCAEPGVGVIGRDKPAGVCGSGLIDFLAEARRVGLLSHAGRFSSEALTRCTRVRKVQDHDAEVLAYEIVPAEETEQGTGPILVTERDIAALLQAKGVIFAAFQIALKHFGITLEELERVYLAGGFARHINLDNAVAMGMLPDIDRDKYVFIGNGSLAGAFLALVDEQVRSRLPHIAAAPTVIELNLDPDFMDAYTMAMFLPGADSPGSAGRGK